ncbi:MAG TPA: DUF3127 domain-containing protein [Saprospiraceae bacterium]|nr:DUF3127 domain-containing protein [Saprospiraceae bacterium]
MSFEVEGTLYKKFDTENKTDSFVAREFVITLEGPYPQYIKFQLTQDRCSAIDSVNEGQKIKVFFDLRGREWNGKYFTNLNAWKIEMPSEIQNSGFAADEPPSFDTFPTQDLGSSGSDDDFNELPF